MVRRIAELPKLSAKRSAGGKAAGLISLTRLDLAVPRTYVISCPRHRSWRRRSLDSRFLSELRSDLSQVVLPDRAYAVRSSSASEDAVSESLAGQLETFLRVVGVDSVVEAVRAIWASDRERLAAYRSKRSRTRDAPMQILVQEMVAAVSAGASFSRNPITGADEVIVEAIEGTSELLLQGGVTPRRWVVPGDTIASDWSALPDEILREIVQTTRRVDRELSYAADLEWAYDGSQLWWLQVRPITSLQGVPVYSNRISREYLPGLVKPLVWSINVPMINGAWVDLFQRAVGPLSIDPKALAKQFHFRAYFNMSGMGELFRKLGLPVDALEQTLGLVPVTGRAPFGFRWRMVRHLPRVVRFLWELSRFRPRLPSWERRVMSRYEESEASLAHAHTPDDLMAWIDQLLPLMREAAGHRILSLLLHLVVDQWGRRICRSKGIEEGPALETVDRRFEPYDPMIHIQRLAGMLDGLSTDARRQAAELSVEAFFRLPQLQRFQSEFRSFLSSFGHLSESGNDFSSQTWNENPTAVLRMVATAGPVHDRRGPARDMPVADRAVRRWARRAATRRLDRERVGAVFSKGLHLLRQWALRLGQELERSKRIERADDVFLLELEELRQTAAGHLGGRFLRKRIADRRVAMKAAKDAILPDVILGDDVAEPVVEPVGARALQGVPVSRGVYEGAACVVRSMEAFDRFATGDVLVVPFSDIAWTPLFARAGAIIAEAGGVLSHSSIVAREFGIPAVVSVPRACSLLGGACVRVNGSTGRVTVLDASRTGSSTDGCDRLPG